MFIARVRVCPFIAHATFVISANSNVLARNSQRETVRAKLYRRLVCVLAKISSPTTQSFETNLRESGRTRIIHACEISCVHVPFYIPRVSHNSTYLKTGSFFLRTRAFIVKNWSYFHLHCIATQFFSVEWIWFTKT